MDGRCILVLTKYAAGVAGLVGGALSMACGEYISVSSQKDAEEADIEKERREQVHSPSLGSSHHPYRIYFSTQRAGEVFSVC